MCTYMYIPGICYCQKKKQPWTILSLKDLPKKSADLYKKREVYCLKNVSFFLLLLKRETITAIE